MLVLDGVERYNIVVIVMYILFVIFAFICLILTILARQFQIQYLERLVNIAQNTPNMAPQIINILR
tara:strand:+ start:1193 stop:1390 length:198 start_codon:yes stop_codon:yes gene_type:complete